MKKKTLKFLFTSPLAVLPVLISAQCGNSGSNIKEEDYLYKIGDQKFLSKNDAIDFLAKQAEKREEIEYDRIFIQDDQKIADNYRIIDEILSEHIKSQDYNMVITLDELKKYLNSNGYLDSNSDGYNQIDITNQDKNVLVYRGKDGIAYENEEEAILSYFNLNRLYTLGYDLIEKKKGSVIECEKKKKVYLSKEEVNNVLLKEINDIESNNPGTSESEKIRLFFEKTHILEKVDNNNNDNYILKIGNDTIIYDKNWRSKTDFFVRNHINRYFKIDNKFYTKEEILNDKFKILGDLTTFNVLKVNSTAGYASYLVDTDKTDKYLLYGDYVHKSVSDAIKQFSNPDKWAKSNASNHDSYHLTENAYLVNSFADFIIKNFNSQKGAVNKGIEQTMHRIYGVEKSEALEYFGDNFIKNIDIFHICDVIDEIEAFLNEAKKIKNQTTQESLYDRLNSIIKMMKRGHKGTLMAQIPVTYFASLSFLIENRASDKMIYVFKKFYKTLITYFNDVFKSLLQDLYLKNNGTPLDLWEEFKANGFDADINMNINAFANLLANSEYITNGLKVIKNSYINVAQKCAQQEIEDLSYHSEISSLPYYDRLRKVFNTFKTLNEGKFVKYDAVSNKYIINSSNSLNFYDMNFLNRLVVHSSLSAGNQFIELGKDKYKKDLSEFKLSLSNLNFSEIDDMQLSKAEETIGLMKKYYLRENRPDELAWLESLDATNNKDMISLIEKVEKFNSDEFSRLYKTDEIAKKNIEEANKVIKKYKKDAKLQKIAKNIASYTDIAVAVFNTGLDWANFLMNSEVNSQTIMEQLLKTSNQVMDFVLAIPSGPIGTLVKIGLKFSLSIIQEGIGHTEYIDYSFIDPEQPNNKYVWNGGKTISRFWGLWKDEKLTIRDAKLLEPVKFIDAFNQTTYYYKGEKYTESEVNAIYNLIVENFNVSNFANEVVYSIYDKNNVSLITAGKDANAFHTPEECLEDFYINRILEFKETNYTFQGNNLENSLSSLSSLKDALINFVKKLEPTYIVQIPKNDRGIPKDQNGASVNLLDDLEKVKNDIINSENAQNYIFFNNRFYKQGSAPLQYEVVKKNLMNEFKKRIFVHSKYVAKSKLITEQNYDKLYPLQKVRIHTIEANGLRYHYLSLNNAIKKLLSPDMLNIKPIDTPKRILNYLIFNGEEFDSYDALKKYIEKFIDMYLIVKKSKE
ncbi:Uncharacterised protein [Mycoplasmopsis californica]|uniref:Lipoprotein n=1 Tax=Mycoplasmopsis equigenitalium TaxID=114883 RepID=A0ABY5J0E8_9BACT|nr:hypothetical protein [Mycoplasmopsis equigenitalium]UUD36733.1 hypothetical protein NPA09_02415 [Mycoplasmopsis equigenitalium]VEU69973.1 Uncharacterised protein [Mycoplasmopsis californica]